eukprot:scaffold648392_cov18-Prasinocladus_malaysianus.AAC.1
MSLLQRSQSIAQRSRLVAASGCRQICAHLSDMRPVILFILSCALARFSVHLGGDEPAENTGRGCSRMPSWPGGC